MSDDKSAIVTGSRKGIGKAVAEHLLNHGWNVAGCSRGAASIVHANYSHYELDVSDEMAVVKMVRSVARQNNGIQALINNAGVASMNHIMLTPAKVVEQVFQVNVFGSFFFLRECAKQMKKRNAGRIINFSTVAVPLQLEGEAVYAASKSAMESLTKTTAKELAPFNITVNAIGPTPIDTDLTRVVPRAKIEELLQQQAFPRLGTTDDVINVIDFYLKPESDFVTGQVIYLGGIHG